MAFNDEMERYMRDRKRRSMIHTSDGTSQPGWWDRVSSRKKGNCRGTSALRTRWRR
ncbi:TPA: hypothetical protein HA251_03180 [Candidatus Woesearchaeota archaeon]|nr:hypothetical protein [Candidatus Woesearchaeota archaeon]